MQEGLSKLAYTLRKAKYFTTVDSIVCEAKGTSLYCQVGHFEVILYDDCRASCSCSNHIIYAKSGSFCSHIVACFHYAIENTKDIRRI